MECYGIVLKRGQKTKKGEYKLSPVYYETGNTGMTDMVLIWW